MRRFATYGPSLLVLVTAASVLLIGPKAIRSMQAAHRIAVMQVAQQELDQDNILDLLNRATRRVAEAVEPSVVYIESRSGGGFSRGSGWVYDLDGHIVTNAHVIRTAAETGGDIRVQFFDGRMRNAEVIGRDISTDIAVLKVDLNRDTLAPIRRATGKPVFQGERVFAFGSPFGLKFSMSEGIVSGLGREATGAMLGAYTNFIQTDAAINPGNSGGPLVDIKGQVIGMNAAIITDAANGDPNVTQNTGVSGGISFAIPLDTIESVVDQIISRKIVLKGYLGVTLEQSLDRRAAERRGFRGDGVLVVEVQPNLPAARSGLQAYDIITEIDGQKTPSLAVLRSLIGNRPPGEVITLNVWRDREFLELDVELAAARFDSATRQLVVVGGDGDFHRFESLVEAIDDALLKFGIEELENDNNGVLIADVNQRSEAQRYGFVEGVRIIGINGQRIYDQGALYDVLGRSTMSTSSRPIPVTVRDRRGRQRELMLPLQIQN